MKDTCQSVMRSDRKEQVNAERKTRALRKVMRDN